MHSRSKHSYYVYILASDTRVLYAGVTSNLLLRITQHRKGTGSEFTARYNITRLVYAEETGDVHAALAREKQIKRWRREKKVALINSVNPDWNDLAVTWLGFER